MILVWKRCLIIFLIFLCGCVKDTKLDEDVTINYPVTGISKVDSEISSYVNRIYSDFTHNKKENDKIFEQLHEKNDENDRLNQEMSYLNNTLKNLKKNNDSLNKR